MEATPAGQVDQLWTKWVCSSNPWPLLVKVKTNDQSGDFHGSSAEIPGPPSCVFVMRHIPLTKGFLQAHSVGTLYKFFCQTPYFPKSSSPAKIEEIWRGSMFGWLLVILDDVLVIQHLCFNITQKGQMIVPDLYNRILDYTSKYCKNCIFKWK